MPIRNTDTEWGVVARFFHWLIAFLVIFMILLGFLMGYATKPISGILYTLHKSIGLTILFIMVLRYLWRISGKVPKYPAGTPVWQATIARWNHGLLYLAVFLMPLSGWIMSTAAGHAPNFWWAVTIPSPWTPLSKTVAGVAWDIHQVLAWVIIGLLCLHLLGVISHLFIRKDGVVQRMLPKAVKKPRYYE